MTTLHRSFEPPRISPPTRASLLGGVLGFRIVVALWMTAVFVWEVWERSGDATKDDVAHPVVGLILLAAAWCVTAAIVVGHRRDPRSVLAPRLVLPEIAVAASLSFADAWVYGATHAQALPTIWPIAAVFTVAIAAGRRLAVITGVGLGLARYVGWLVFPFPTDDGPWSLARISSIVLFGVAGWVAGLMLQQQQAADRAISAFRAREEVARTLHDGVLQTLAVIQRRSDDTELVRLARTQERELRSFLFDGGIDTPPDMAAALRSAAARATDRHGIDVQVICAPDLPAGREPVIGAVAGAVGEALTNAVRHGRATSAVVYAEPGDDSDFFVSIKDRGEGFDPASVAMGQGIARSIRGRVEEVGGRVEIDGRPGSGAEVRLFV